MKAQYLEEEQVLELLKKQQGSRKANQFAEEIGVTPQYLSDVYRRRRTLGPKILAVLKVRKIYTRNI